MLNDEGLSKYLNLEVAGLSARAKVVSPASVVTAPWVSFKCLYGCKDQTWTCPPYSPTYLQTRAVLDSFQRAILYNYQVPPESNSRELTRSIKEALVDLEGEMFKDGCYKAFAFLQGPCLICKECGRSTGATTECKFRQRARPSMEACGIDVFQTARNNGFTIVPLKTRQDLRNHFCLMMVD